MLTIVTWLWGDKYGAADVDKLARGLWRNLKQRYRMLVIADRPERLDSDLFMAIPIPEQDRFLLDHKGCFVRLRMFDPVWQKANNLHDRIACVDLDTIPAGNLDPLFLKPETFSILTGANSQNPCPYNGSLMMLRAGAHADVWSDFSIEAANQVPFFEFPDDQGWLAHKVPGVVGWKVGSPSGVYAFQKPGWPKGDDLPKDARLVVFPGWRSPEKFKHIPWIKENWI